MDETILEKAVIIVPNFKMTATQYCMIMSHNRCVADLNRRIAMYNALIKVKQELETELRES